MHDDKAFAVYALLLILGVATALTSGMLLFGNGTWPSALAVVEHVALGLLMRAAYKTIGGWNWADWSVAGDAVPEAASAEEVLAGSGAAMGAAR